MIITKNRENIISRIVVKKITNNIKHMCLFKSYIRFPIIIETLFFFMYSEINEINKKKKKVKIIISKTMKICPSIVQIIYIRSYFHSSKTEYLIFFLVFFTTQHTNVTNI